MPAASWARRRSRGSGSCGASFTATPDVGRGLRWEARPRSGIAGGFRPAAGALRERSPKPAEHVATERLRSIGVDTAPPTAAALPLRGRRDTGCGSAWTAARCRKRLRGGRAGSAARRLAPKSRVSSPGPRREHVRASARPRRSTSIAGDVAGIPRRRSTGKQGLRYPADPPKVEEIVGVMRSAGDDAHGRRLRGLIVVMWRAGLGVREALALTEGDLDQRRGSLLIRRGKGGRRREVGMDACGWEQLQPWLEIRRELPVGPLLCVINVCSSLTLTRPQYQPSYRRDIRVPLDEASTASPHGVPGVADTAISAIGRLHA
jgi:hypothetical protein